MIVLITIDVVAAVVVVVGFHIAFRQKVVRTLIGRSAAQAGQPDELASVFRILGVMLMAFAITLCVFANLIAHYSAAPAH